MLDRRSLLRFLGISIGSLAANQTLRAESLPTPPEPFGFKMQWVSVRCESVDEVVRALSLRSPRKASWKAGIDCAYQLKEAFVAPPVQGWISIVGFGIGDFDPQDSVAAAKRRIGMVTPHFQTVCAFATHRVVEYHQWIRATDGRINRCFAYLGERGEVLCNEGNVTDVERHLTFGGKPPGEWVPDEQDVMTVARGWSYDPSTLSAASAKPAFGVIATWK
jgi:hypothetical protein